MTELKGNQALFLWRMITGEDINMREPKLSDAKPALDAKTDRKKLIDEGYLEVTQRGRAKHLLLTEKAWSWAASAREVQLLKSRSSVGAEALEGLLHRLLPYLKRHEIPLAALFMEDSGPEPKVTPPPRAPVHDPGSVAEEAKKIEAAYLSLTGGRRQVRVLLRDLRAALSEMEKSALDRALIGMQDTKKVVLYREDNTAALTAADHEAALIVGDSPRHLVYMED